MNTKDDDFEKEESESSNEDFFAGDSKPKHTFRNLEEFNQSKEAKSP